MLILRLKKMSVQIETPQQKANAAMHQVNPSFRVVATPPRSSVFVQQPQPVATTPVRGNVNNAATAPRLPPRGGNNPAANAASAPALPLHASTTVLSRKTIRKLNLQTCESCGGHGARCVCGSIEVPWFGNTFVNDGHQNFCPLHQYFVLGGIFAGIAVPSPSVYTLAAITKNTISVAPTSGIINDLAVLGLVSTVTTADPRLSKFGDLFLITGLTGANAVFNGEYRVIQLPTSSSVFFVLQALDGTSDCLAPQINDLIRVWYANDTSGGNIGMVQITAITGGGCAGNSTFTVQSAQVQAINPLRQVHVMGCQTSNSNIVL